MAKQKQNDPFAGPDESAKKPSSPTPDDFRASRFVWQSPDEVQVEDGISVPKRLESTVRSVRKIKGDEKRANRLQKLIKDKKISQADLSFLMFSDALTRPMSEIAFE